MVTWKPAECASTTLARTQPDVLSPHTITLETSINVRCEESGVPWKIEARCLVIRISVGSTGKS